MKTAFMFSIHQTDKELDPVIFEGFTATYDRLMRAMRYAMKIEAVFQCHPVTLADDEWMMAFDKDRARFKKWKHWGYDLPPQVGK